jgi:vanillate/3-O-methylgallate O-demethylase
MNDSSSGQAVLPMNLVQMLRMAPASYHPGWGGPEYTSWKDEQMSRKKTCYIGDWSCLWNLIVERPDVLKPFSDTKVTEVPDR